jgi:uncharacterized protein YdeI (YjbR/CyaY-like superfamily)
LVEPVSGKPRQFKQRQEFRDWLQEHHASETELWLLFYKKGSGKKSISNEEAVEEALCFGWINGKVRRIDAERYKQRFSPRHAKSIWAASNKKRVAKLIAEGLMTEAGMEKVEAAKANGSWTVLDKLQPDTVPADLASALKANKRAHTNFGRFTANQRRDYLWWLNNAKRAETRRKRIEEIVRRAENNIKPGMS